MGEPFVKMLGTTLAVAALGGLAVCMTEQVKQPAPAPVQHHSAPLHGKVVLYSPKHANRFTTPVKVAPVIQPVALKGHAWRWHPRVGWVAFPEGLAPVALVLGENTGIPGEAKVYETAPVSCQMTCPHCGLPVRVTLD